MNLLALFSFTALLSLGAMAAPGVPHPVPPPPGSGNETPMKFKVTGFGLPLAECKLVDEQVSKCHMLPGVKLEALMQALYVSTRDNKRLHKED